MPRPGGWHVVLEELEETGMQNPRDRGLFTLRGDFSYQPGVFTKDLGE